MLEECQCNIVLSQPMTCKNFNESKQIYILLPWVESIQIQETQEQVHDVDNVMNA